MLHCWVSLLFIPYTATALAHSIFHRMGYVLPFMDLLFSLPNFQVLNPFKVKMLIALQRSVKMAVQLTSLVEFLWLIFVTQITQPDTNDVILCNEYLWDFLFRNITVSIYGNKCKTSKTIPACACDIINWSTQCNQQIVGENWFHETELLEVVSLLVKISVA